MLLASYVDLLVSRRHSILFPVYKTADWLVDWLAGLCPFCPISCHGIAFVFIFGVGTFVFDPLVPPHPLFPKVDEKRIQRVHTHTSPISATAAWLG